MLTGGCQVFFFFASDLCPVRLLVTVRCFSAGFSSKNRTCFGKMCVAVMFIDGGWKPFSGILNRTLVAIGRLVVKRNNLQFRQVAQRFLYLVVGVV